MKNKYNALFIFFIVFLLSLFTKLFVIDLLYVSGNSMYPAIKPKSFLLEYHLKWGIPIPFSNTYLMRWGNPTEGDIVIYPWQGRLVVKRCIGTENTQLVFFTQNGYSVRVNEQIVPLSLEQFNNLKNIHYIPKGMIFAVGDNVNESYDSRDYGFISIDSICGTVLCR